MPPKKNQSLGSALIRHRFNRSKGYEHTNASRLHSLDTEEGKPVQGLVSVIDRTDLEEIMHTAELADRDFAAERGSAQIIISSDSSSAYSQLSKQERLKLQKAEEELHQASLKIPRRPSWTPQMTTEELDDVERKSFLEWRRGLASLEENDSLVLTPFEKNLDIWRQLWRVLERSDVIVTVVDSRNPLFYRCLDLEAYVKELDECKRTMLLLNKADLLPPSARKHWANYFAEHGIGYMFWSAKEATEAMTAAVTAEDSGVAAMTEECEDAGDESIRILNRTQLLERLQAVALDVVQERKAMGRGAGSSSVRPERTTLPMVGFVGYPNVGKSSSINALAGQKKTGVTSTPGKTKHFQTLILSDDLMLCDCPGLVFPSFSSSRSEMVAAGVLPIDRLTDQRGPVEIVAERVPRGVLEQTYGISIAKPAAHEHKDRPPTAAELLRAYARSRGYVASSGLPDETRASRNILKDYLSGKLLDYHLPPTLHPQEAPVELSTGHPDDENSDWESDEHGGPDGALGSSSGDPEPLPPVLFDEMDSMSLAGDISVAKERRRNAMKAEHKMHKKSARKKDRTWRVGHGGKDDTDGMPIVRAVVKPLSHGAANSVMVKPEDRKKIDLA